MTFQQTLLAIKNGQQPKTGAKPKKAIAKLSKKRQKVQRKYVKIVAAEANKDNECQVKSPVCTFFMSGMHHVIKRSPNNLINLDGLLKCCTPCNGFLETNDAWGREQGFVKSKFKK